MVRHCGICQSGEATWLHTLDPGQSTFRVYGKGHTWAQEIEVCDRCEKLLARGDVEGLVRASPRTSEESEQDVDEQIRNGLVALIRADLGSIPIAQWLPPGSAELDAEGFVPLSELTGAVHLAQVWPERDRRAVPETRAGRSELSEDGMCWFVRSPWPSIPLQDVLALIWSWVERQMAQSPGPRRYDEELEKSLAEELLNRDEAGVRRLQSELG